MSAYDKLAVCLFNFKCKALEREEERRRKEHDGELGEREREREEESEGCRHISGTGREGCLRCWMLVCGVQIRHCTSFGVGCSHPRVWEVKSWQWDRC